MSVEFVTAAGALMTGALCLLIGWTLGARIRRMDREKAHAEGRAEASVEVARLQERVTFLEAISQQQRERVRTLENDLERAQGRALRAETECAQLRERLTPMSDLEKARERAEGEAETFSRDLAAQRELVSRLTAQIEAATIAGQGFQQRIADLAGLERQLRGELNARDSELASQRELVSRLQMQVESASSREDHANERIAGLGALECTLRAQVSERETIIQQLREQHGALRAELDSTSAAVRDLQAAEVQWERERTRLQEQLVKLNVAHAELQTSLATERTHSEEKLNVLLSSRDALVNQFKSLASEILEEKSKRFTEQNAAALGQLLSPVREQLQAFHTKVDEVYRTEGQERAALGEQLKQLVQLNQSLSVDAQNLTRALKGDQKTQGTWGEIVLDTVLEQAGLIEGTHYDRQTAYEGDDQKRAIPDVVIRLPGDRQLVIDSKVSLTAYERSATATTAEEREIHVKQHLASLRNHIRALSEKNYQQLYQLKSLDFVLLFVPLEPAFSAAVSHDNLIFREAWDRNVILVSPSTLLFVVRTVAYLWRQENQTRNVLEIAKRGAALYDKLCGFVEDLADVGKRIQQTVKAYDGAMRKLAIGDGNVIRQAEMLRDLGVKPSKQLPMSLVDKALSKAQHSLLADETNAADSGEGAVPEGEPAQLAPASLDAGVGRSQDRSEVVEAAPGL
jgi:DNA recombination protein RmuC